MLGATAGLKTVRGNGGRHRPDSRVAGWAVVFLSGCSHQAPPSTPMPPSVSVITV